MRFKTSDLNAVPGLLRFVETKRWPMHGSACGKDLLGGLFEAFIGQERAFVSATRDVHLVSKEKKRVMDLQHELRSDYEYLRGEVSTLRKTNDEIFQRINDVRCILDKTTPERNQVNSRNDTLLREINEMGETKNELWKAIDCLTREKQELQQRGTSYGPVGNNMNEVVSAHRSTAKSKSMDKSPIPIATGFGNIEDFNRLPAVLATDPYEFRTAKTRPYHVSSLFKPSNSLGCDTSRRQFKTVIPNTRELMRGPAVVSTDSDKYRIPRKTKRPLYASGGFQSKTFRALSEPVKGANGTSQIESKRSSVGANVPAISTKLLPQ